MSSPVYNPSVPYDCPIPGGFLPGRMVRVQGRVPSSAHSFAINLQNGPISYDDIALHLNARFTEQCIVRNARIGGNWGTEERDGPMPGVMPINRNENFEILLLSEATSYKIAINGQHFAEFPHRVQPLDRVNHLRIEGDLTIQIVQMEGVAAQTASFAATAPPLGYGAGGGGGGGLPYPAHGGGLPTPGFTMPPVGGGGYPPPVGGHGGGYSPPMPAQSPYGGYPPAQGGGGGYYPPPQAPAQGYPPPGGAYPPGGQGGGYYQPGGVAPPPQYPPGGGSGGGGGGGGGLLGNAGKLLAGGLAGVGLAKVANKIPGMGGGGGHHGGGGYPHPGGGYPGGHSGGGGGGGGGLGALGPLGGILAGAGAMGIGGAVAGKGMKKQKKNKLLKYGLPVGGALVGGYALKKGMKGFGGHHRGGSSSSSSSSSEEE